MWNRNRTGVRGSRGDLAVAEADAIARSRAAATEIDATAALP
ncbi:MAG: hypothetical protein ACOZNI_28880 [Myxococcota bacterium]